METNNQLTDEQIRDAIFSFIAFVASMVAMLLILTYLILR